MDNTTGISIHVVYINMMINMLSWIPNKASIRKRISFRKFNEMEIYGISGL